MKEGGRKEETWRREGEGGRDEEGRGGGRKGEREKGRDVEEGGGGGRDKEG